MKFAFILTLILLSSCNVADIAMDIKTSASSTFNNNQSYVTASKTALSLGESLTVTLQLRNQQNSPLILSNQNIEFELVDGTGVGNFSAVIDNHDGSYTSTLTAVAAGSAVKIEARVNGLTVTSIKPEIMMGVPGIFTISTPVMGMRNATLSWTNASAATSYEVYRGLTSDAISTLESNNALSPYAVTDIDSGQTHHFAVRATNSFGYRISTASGIPGNEIVGIFMGAIGLTSSSSGSCPSSGVTSNWCTGGTFTPGTDDGMFNFISAMSIDTDSRIMYVLDRGNHRLSKVDLKTGAYIGSIGRLSSSSGSCPTSGNSSGWCTGGTFTAAASDGGISTPRGLAVDKIANVALMTDAGHRIIKFELSTGLFQGAIGYATSSSGDCPTAAPTTGWCLGGTFGINSTTDSGMNAPKSIVIDSQNDAFFVADYDNHRILKFVLSTGAPLGAIGYVNTVGGGGTCVAGSATTTGWCTRGVFSQTAAAGGFNRPWGLALNHDTQTLYVSEIVNARIQAFNAMTGVYISTISSSNQSRELAIDPVRGKLYAAHSNLHLVAKYDITTNLFEGSLGYPTASSGTCVVGDISPFWCTGGTFGFSTIDGGFSPPAGVAFDEKDGFLYVGEDANSRIQRFR